MESHGMTVASSAFSQGQPIPSRFSCDGDDISPALEWSGAPDGTESFAVIMDDPDAPGGMFVHWVYFNIPPTVSSLPEAVEAAENPAPGGSQGTNGFRRIGYGGPCPPRDTHRYFFKLYALDAMLDIEPGSTKKQFLAAAEPHILAGTELMGTYSR